MGRLNFTQKTFLTTYKIFTGNNYKACPNSNDFSNIHNTAQSICYLMSLNVHAIEIGDFGYMWNGNGPYSSGLLALLRSLDRNGEKVEEFYRSGFSDFSNNGLSAEHISTVKRMKKTLVIQDHQESEYKWIRLLGALTYISRTMLPGAPFEVVNKELEKLSKNLESDKEISHHAWEILVGNELVLSFT